MPEWNADNQRFVSSYYDTFDDKYRAVVDTVNMAAVEGALKYVQAECINASAVTDCERKNNIKYVVFYQTTIAQPVAAMDYYANATDQYDFAIEHCPFMAMDGGQCDPNPDGSFPDICNQYIGADGQPDLGFCVGGTLQDNEDIAPYPHNYWFSFPNSCPQELWDDKTDTCREEYAGGMCALGVEPDGVTCSFSYEILGYILLDDVVGITSLINPLTLTYYADYKEFCEAGGIEFAVDLLGNILSWLAGLPFWANPGDSDANAERVEKLVSAYDALVVKTPTTSDGGTMKALPTIEALQALNPPCYENKKSYGSLVIQKVESKFIRRDSRQKWFMLAILSVLSALNQGICFSYAPIASIVEERWEQRIHSTELITVYFITYIPCSFVGSWIMDKKGLRFGVLLGGFLQALGASLRYFACAFEPTGEAYVTLLGQILASIAMPFMVNSPAVLSANWFPPSMRATSTSVAVNANAMGTAFVYLTAPFIVLSSDEVPYWNLYVALVAIATADTSDIPRNRSM
ncbi:hypothetical protein JM16_007971 [Phytophthora kernoviae]|uniref:Major facilitator superfamily (MFS) profile domain-containing protein n=1 Tax=Phytophthora kernoviae TaxID=325452 RepID=A0A8T0LMS8_9STRA|nr:hypothetical protein JM16_007971 [Phytophthora kernoviae]